MKIAIVSGPKDGGVDQVMRPLAAAMQARGHTADLIDACAVLDAEAFANKLNDSYDLVHYGFFAYSSKILGKVFIPQTVNIWHIAAGQIEPGFLAERAYRRIITDEGDVTTLQQLGQMGATNVTPIPILFDYSKFSHLPPPPGPFTVGIFCNAYASKRHDIILKAAREAGVPCHAVIAAPDRTAYDIDPIAEVYSQIHALAHASFVDTNSLPAREALLCGRPVLATRSGGLAQVLQDGVNGLWHDGSASDLADKMREMRDNYAHFAQGAGATTMPGAATIAAQYEAVWGGILEDE